MTDQAKEMTNYKYNTGVEAEGKDDVVEFVPLETKTRMKEPTISSNEVPIMSSVRPQSKKIYGGLSKGFRSSSSVR